MKKINNVFRIIILVSSVIFINIIIGYYSKEIIHKNKVNRIISGMIKNRYSDIDNEYDGYIYFYKNNKKLLIKKGNYNKVLNDNNVFLYSDYNSFNSLRGEVVLLGHNNHLVFGFLHHITKKDIFIVSSLSTSKKYIVYDVRVIDQNNMDLINSNNQIILVTCTDNDTKRLIIYARQL